jgi:16S rRNA G966 N2-methylase RsmD
MAPGKQSKLQRVVDLEIRIQGSRVSLIGPAGPYPGSADSMAILDVFATARTLDDGLANLGKRAQGALHWAKMVREVMCLCDAGILVAPGNRTIELPSHNGAFTAADVHVRMLDDDTRTSAFLQALFKQISPDDVVVDIGSGTGILAATAALAGAKHVYAIERSSNYAALARSFVEHNGLSHRVTVIEGDSTRVQLPEKATLLVSEVIGNDPLNEGLLPMLVDARKRHLQPGARIIPQRLQIFALPLFMPDSMRNRVLFSKEAAARWKQKYQLDFSIYTEYCAGQSFHTLCSSRKVRQWPRLSKPALVADLDLESVDQSFPDPQARMSLTFNTDGLLNAVLVYFILDLGANVRLSVHPDSATDTNHWASYIWIPGTPISARAGVDIEIDYQWNAVKNRSELALRP